MTIPSTRYVSNHPIPEDLLPGNHAQEAPSDPHWPLVFMLVLSQLAVGTSIVAVHPAMSHWAAPAAALIGAVALGIGSMHLGRPLKAWRAFLGWRTSWFSREVILFSVFIPLALVSAVLAWNAPADIGSRVAAVATAVVGLLAVGCSAMLYVDTRRAFWSAQQCFGQFLGTTLLLGLIVGVGVTALSGNAVSFLAGPVLLLLTLAKIGLEQRVARHWVDSNTSRRTPLNKTARLLAGELGMISRLRVAFGLVSACGFSLLPLVADAGISGRTVWVASCGMGLCLLAEGMERYLFFAAVSVQGMPGKGAA